LCGRLSIKQENYKRIIIKRGGKVLEDQFEDANLIVVPNSISFQNSKKFQTVMKNDPIVLQESKLRQLLCLDDKFEKNVKVVDVPSPQAIVKYSGGKKIQKRMVYLCSKSYDSESRMRTKKIYSESKKALTKEVKYSIEKEWEGTTPCRVQEDDDIFYKFVNEEDIKLWKDGSSNRILILVLNKSF